MSTYNKKNTTTTRGNGRRTKQPEAFVQVPCTSRRNIGQIIRALPGVRSATGAAYIRFQESQGEDPATQVNSPTATGRVKIASREKEAVEAAKIAVEELIAGIMAHDAKKVKKAQQHQHQRSDYPQREPEPVRTAGPKIALNPLEAALEAALAAQGPVSRPGRTGPKRKAKPQPTAAAQPTAPPAQSPSTPTKEEGEWITIGKAPPAPKKQPNKKSHNNNQKKGKKLVFESPKQSTKPPTGCWGGSLDTIRSATAKAEAPKRPEPIVVTGAERVVMAARREARRDIASMKSSPTRATPTGADAAWEEDDLDAFYQADNNSAWDDED